MIRQLAIGTLVIAITVAVQAEMFNLLSQHFETVVRFCRGACLVSLPRPRRAAGRGPRCAAPTATNPYQAAPRTRL